MGPTIAVIASNLYVKHRKCGLPSFLNFNANWGFSEIESLERKNISKFKMHHYSAGAMFFIQDW
jgi:hypothetical protein